MSSSNNGHMVPSLSVTRSLSEGENILIIKKLIKEDRVICIWANLVHILRRPILAISNIWWTERPPDGDRLQLLTGNNGFPKRAVLEGKLLLAGLFQLARTLCHISQSRVFFSPLFNAYRGCGKWLDTLRISVPLVKEKGM